ncbi:MAG: protein kinase [Candidatus Hydrogenedentes bacterium]|nr:protein kinase [Candidatus Hydrogenedentota bacterium]
MAQTLRQGALLGDRFKLVRLIGQGAVGMVWLALDTHLDDEHVACKVLRQELATDRRALADLKREVLLTRRLRHPAIVAVYTFWAVDEARFITMEYVPGRNLAESLVERGKPFAVADVTPWIEQLCRALSFAHGQGILHRDVKPANVLAVPGKGVRLADFGIARTAREARRRLTGLSTSGTLLFMSPEQLAGEPLDPRSDIYGLASSVYTLLNGAPPFHEGSVAARIQLDEAVPVPGLPEAFNHLLLKALSKDRDRRHPSCRAFWREWSAAAQGVDGTTIRAADSRPVFDPDAETVRLAPRGRRELPQRLGDLLLEAGAISTQQLEEALAAQERTDMALGRILLDRGHVREADIVRVLEKQLDLQPLRLDEEAFQPEAVKLLTASLAVQCDCVPIRLDAGRLVVAMADPLDLNAVNAIEEASGCPAEPRVATHTAIHEAIGQVYGTNAG